MIYCCKLGTSSRNDGKGRKYCRCYIRSPKFSRERVKKERGKEQRKEETKFFVTKKEKTVM